MGDVTRQGDDFIVAADLLAKAFGLDPAEVQPLMRAGTLVGRTERGMDEDAGRWRLTFQYGGMACRFIVDDEGQVLKRARFPLKGA